MTTHATKEKIINSWISPENKLPPVRKTVLTTWESGGHWYYRLAHVEEDGCWYNDGRLLPPKYWMPIPPPPRQVKEQVEVLYIGNPTNIKFGGTTVTDNFDQIPDMHSKKFGDEPTIVE